MVKAEYGPGSYNLLGVVVVGSVAAGTERPLTDSYPSDIDVFPVVRHIEHDGDREEVTRFIGVMTTLTGRRIESLTTVRVSLGEFVEASDWNDPDDLDLPEIVNDWLEERGRPFETAIHFFPLGHHVEGTFCQGCPDQDLIIPGLDELQTGP